MSKVNEKYASEALLSEEARKKLGLVIKNGSVTTDKLKDGAVTPDKLEPGLWENIDSTNRETQEGLNRLQEWMNEFAGGLEITANTDSYEAGKSASVTITAKTKTGKKGDWVIRDSNNVTVYEKSDASQITYTQTIDKDTYYSIACKQGDQTATGQWAIIAAFPTWLGAGNSYTDIKTDAYKRVVGKKVEGRYEVTVASGQRIYLLTPKEVVISKVTMGGFEIPMNDVEEVTLAISDYGNKVYKMYESSNTYQEGTYQVSVNVSDSELVEHIEAIDRKIDNYPVADGEDIVAVTKTQPTEQQVLMLADKAYHPASFSGLGRKYLRKNIIPIEHEYKVFGGFVENVEVKTQSVTITSGSPLNVVFDRVKEVFLYEVGLSKTKKYYMSWSSEEVPMSDYALTSEPLDMIFMYNGVPYKWDGENLLVDDEIQEDGLMNLLTQDMINKPNTIYHIQYDYDLNGQTITVPTNCTIEFDGGSLNNGYLNGIVLQIVSGNLNDVILEVTENFAAEKTIFKGGPLNNSGTSYSNALVTLDKTNYALIANCEFIDGRLGLYADSCSNTKVTNSKFENFTFWGNYFRSGTNLILQNNICINVNDGIKLTGLLENVFIEGNNCYSNVRDGIDFAGHSVKSCAIVNNFLHDNTFAGIEFKSLDRNIYPISQYDVEESDLYFVDINISNNTIINNSIGINSFSYYGSTMGVRLDRISFNKNNISNNLSPANTHGMHISYWCKQSNGISIFGNVLQGQFDTAIIVSNARYTVIKDNIINNDNTGIRIDSQDYDSETLQVSLIGNIVNTYRQSALDLRQNIRSIYIIENRLKSIQGESIKDSSGSSSNVMFDNEPLDFRRKVTDSQMAGLSELLITINAGYSVFNETQNKPMWWNGTAWVDATGVIAGTSTSGTFANKPTVSANSISIGFKYFCTDKQTTEGATNGIEIIHKGSDVWVDALGRVVS